MGLDAMILVFWMLNFKPAFSLSSFTFIKRLFSSSSVQFSWAQFSSILLGHVQLFVTPYTAACQTSLSFPNSQSLLKLMSIKSAMPSKHLILCRPLLLPPSIFPSTGSLPMNIRAWFPLELTGCIYLQSKRLFRVFSNTTIWKHQFFSTQHSLWSNSHICTWVLEKP